MTTFVLALWVCGAADGGGVEPTTHFVDSAGNTLERLEPAWTTLHAFFREATPRTVLVEYQAAEQSTFSTARGAVQLSLAAWAKTPVATVAHETAHLGLAQLTAGASDTEPFRFLDEGLAQVLEHRVAGDLPAFRAETLAVAAAEHAAGKARFASMQAWYTYFGRPPNRELRAYASAASVVFFLLESSGEEQLRAFLVDLGRTRDLDASARATLQKSAAAVESGWTTWLSAQGGGEEPALRLVRLSPAPDSEVPAGLQAVEVEFSVDMASRPLCVVTPCKDDLCYTDASWVTPRVLRIRAPKGLRKSTPYQLTLGKEGCQLRSLAGQRLPVTDWRFRTR